MGLDRKYISFFEFIVERVYLIVESSCSNFASFIEKVNCEQTTLTTLIMPFFYIGFISNTNSNSPSTYMSHEPKEKEEVAELVLIWRKSLNRINGNISTKNLISNVK